ncbi:MAG: glycoside hydrolase family 2 protein [Opitutales bacterium]
MNRSPILPRPEYPRPQARRPRWLNLNGDWAFAEDLGDDPSLQTWEPERFPETIRVPFCRESALSGIGRTTHVRSVGYARRIEIPEEWAGQRVLLHFGAADYETTVWVDGKIVGQPHRGGHTSFTLDLSALVRPGESHLLTVRCEDDPKLSKPCGKQRSHPENSGCHYVQTTGIWQTVWLEPVPEAYLDRPRITPLADEGAFLVEQRVRHLSRPGRLRIAARADGSTVATVEQALAMDPTAVCKLVIPEESRRLWSPEDPFLYDLVIEWLDADGTVLDRLESYAGLRSIAIRDGRVHLNGKAIFQRLILDQGYYPDGLLTAPDDAALVRDIEIGLRHGFNGARLHQKIFEERFLYHADRLGYLVWGELPDWGPEFQKDEPKTIDARWIEEWLEAVARDYSHPALLAWCPLNEQEAQNPRHLAELETVQRSLVLATRLADRSRPVLDASGWLHRCPEGELYDDHSYEQDPAKLAARYADLSAFSATSRGAPDNTVHSGGRPFFLSEFGGMATKWTEGDGGDDAAWGYGRPPASEAEYLDRFGKQCAALLDNPACSGYCFTQLTDVFQEQNGLVTFDRREKFDPAAVARAHRRPARIEGAAG